MKDIKKKLISQNKTRFLLAILDLMNEEKVVLFFIIEIGIYIYFVIFFHKFSDISTLFKFIFSYWQHQILNNMCVFPFNEKPILKL